MLASLFNINFMNELAPRPVNDVRKLETEDAEQIVKVRPRRNA